MYAYRYLILSFIGIICLTAEALTRCSNSPYRPGEAAENTLFLPYYNPPTKLDPASSYATYEGFVLYKINEMPFEYHYLKRPYQLIGLTAESVPEPAYYDKDGNPLPENGPAEQVARAEYTIRLKKGIVYQDHPCFAKDADGKPLYRNLTAADVRHFDTPNDFPQKGTRELVAEDYVRAIRRLADPRFACPVLSTLERHILGLGKLSTGIARILEEERAKRKAVAGMAYSQEQDESANPIRLDYLKLDCEGVQLVDRYTFKVTLCRKYPEILNWMAMSFFSPVPQEALDFYDQAALIEKQIVLNMWPVGTGAYYLEEFRPNEKIVLRRNKNYRPDYYPSEGEEGDREAGYLDDAGKRLPLIDKMVMVQDKETIPTWNKFQQGYYDSSGIYEEVFGQTVQVSKQGDSLLTEEMESRGIRLDTSISMTIFSFGFNMLDDVVGGYEPEKCKLRQAISIAMDYTEYLDIFANSRGVPAQGVVPPEIFGVKEGPEGVNPYVDEWDPVRKRPVRQSIEVARRLMAEAGYPGGRDPNGNPLVLYYDHASEGDPNFPAVFSWMRRRMALIGIQLRERGTELKRAREKTDSGNFQTYSLGWVADYPDPENFFFLLYGPNAKVKFGGENVTNYERPAYDRLFEQMESMKDGPERLAVIEKMTEIIRRDAPWAWGYHSLNYSLFHGWYKNTKTNIISMNTLRFQRVDPELRAKCQKAWNKPRVWPVSIFVTALLAGLLPGIIMVHRRERGQ